ncbi:MULTISPECIES: cupredoxin domain-containing protein [Anaeromyxobacter]|uniref:cupredoxin domain-containing protein n=1 Tax=Anaeromyxobacter TaxID=161492 RepID=UPI001F581880|nr:MULTISPECIES: cupredoxin domain-containing protein [unclassified Anaeromyxobacter]
MDVSEVAVVAGGVAAIGWVNWYFFLAERRKAAVAAKVGATGVQQAVIRVEGGYSPARVRLRAGQPARLVFDRREDSSCSEEVVIPELGLRRFLPAHQRTSVDLPAQRAGTYEFTCGMGMLRGSLVVEEE